MASRAASRMRSGRSQKGSMVAGMRNPPGRPRRASAGARSVKVEWGGLGDVKDGRRPGATIAAAAPVRAVEVVVGRAVAVLVAGAVAHGDERHHLDAVFAAA